MNTEPLTTLKGIGEKTEKLFAKVGIYNLQQLLHYYPRDYDCYAEPVPLRECRQEEKNAVYGRIVHSPSVKGNQRKSVVVLELYEEPVRLQLTWFNMPFLRSTLKKGSVFIFRGKIQEKSGRLVMEQPEIFTPAAYHELLASLQPVYGLTAGLTNKMVSLRRTICRKKSVPGMNSVKSIMPSMRFIFQKTRSIWQRRGAELCSKSFFSSSCPCGS